MKLKIRPYQNDDDNWHIRQFLRQTMILNHHRERNWHVARWDYWWWFANPDIEKLPLEETVFLWETHSGQIAAVLNPEGRGQTFMQVHPDHYTSDLAEEMIVLAEERMTTTGKDGHQRLQFYIDSQDRACREILERRGFQRLTEAGYHEVQHRRSLDEPLPDVPQINGYEIRSMGDGLELLERCYASGLGFHDNDINVARGNRDHPEWYHHIQTAPLYRRDLDIVAVASDGAIASFCTAWFDDVSRTAYLEPVATVPAHRKHGLATAVILEVLQRLKQMGCQVAFVGGYSQAANALYFSVMGPEHDVSEAWEKKVAIIAT